MINLEAIKVRVAALEEVEGIIHALVMNVTVYNVFDVSKCEQRIISARTDLSALVAEVERLRAENEKRESILIVHRRRVERLRKIEAAARAVIEVYRNGSATMGQLMNALDALTIPLAIVAEEEVEDEPR